MKGNKIGNVGKGGIKAKTPDNKKTPDWFTSSLPPDIMARFATKVRPVKPNK